jgi:hypothetical protein
VVQQLDLGTGFVTNIYEVRGVGGAKWMFKLVGPLLDQVARFYLSNGTRYFGAFAH